MPQLFMNMEFVPLDQDFKKKFLKAFDYWIES